MEVRRSPRLAAKMLPKERPIVPSLELYKSINNKKTHSKQAQNTVYQKHDQTFLFINFIVHGLMKYEMNDPKAEEMKEKTATFLQLTVFFVLIKCVLWYTGCL